MSRVVSLGNAVADVVALVPALPRRGADLQAAGGVVAGGGGLRVLLAARAAGAAAAFAGRIGTGPFGELLRAALDRERIEVLLPPVPGVDSGFAVTLLEPDGERTFVTVRGAEDADPALAGLRQSEGDLVHVSGYGLGSAPRAQAVAGFVAAVPAAHPVLYDPGPLGTAAEPAALSAVLDRADWWSGNEREAEAQTGSADAAMAASVLAARVRRGAVVRLGAEGCLLAETGADPVLLPAPVVDAVDTNGAGDTHVGAFLAALAAGSTPLVAAEAANVAAARFVAGAAR